MNPGLSIIIPTSFAKYPFSIELSRTLILPEVLLIRPHIALKNIDFPEPFLPTIPYIFPISKFTVILFNIGISLIILDKPSIVIE